MPGRDNGPTLVVGDTMPRLDADADAFAASTPPLSLPNLKRSSPKNLAALLTKGDVEIPLIEALGLIAEPDGSPTEDVLLPEGFQQRPLRQQQEPEPIKDAPARVGAAVGPPGPPR